MVFLSVSFRMRNKNVVGNAVETDENPSQNIGMSMTTKYGIIKITPQYYFPFYIIAASLTFGSIETDFHPSLHRDSAELIPKTI